MTDLLFKAQKYMNGEDALTAKGLMGKWKKEETGESHGKKKDHKDSYLEAKTSKSSLHTLKKKMNFTLSIIPVGQNSNADKGWTGVEMAQAVKHVLKEVWPKEVLPFS